MEDKRRLNIEEERLYLINNLILFISSRGRLVISMVNMFPHSLFTSTTTPQPSTQDHHDDQAQNDSEEKNG